MSGKLTFHDPLTRLFARRRLTTYVFLSLLFAIALICVAITDFFITARAKDQQLQVAGLRSELAQFILALREDEGPSLVENATTVSKESRPLAILQSNKPFFTYFLNKANLRSFSTANLRWDLPQSCILEFGIPSDEITGSKFTIQTCFAAVPSDPNGRYIYFALKYPDDRVVRHKQGSVAPEGDKISITLSGDRTSKFDLVFEAPNTSRTQKKAMNDRYLGLHEVTAYSSEAPQRPIRTVNAQAYERLILDESGREKNHVILLGRIDSSMILNPAANQGSWPPHSIRQTGIGISFYNTDSEKLKGIQLIDISSTTNGKSLRSLERLYISQILSKAHLELRAIESNKTIWKSSVLNASRNDNTSGISKLFQIISDWWASLFFSVTGFENSKVSINHPIDGKSSVEAILKADPVILPDIATRFFLWLSLALVALLFMAFVWVRAITRLQSIIQTAYRMTVSPKYPGKLDIHLNRQDEIGSLARTFSVLLKRTRSRSAMIIQSAERRELARSTEIRLAQENLKARQSILGAIGHEIRSPLQSLENRITSESDLRQYVEKMKRAVEALAEATSIEAALKESSFNLRPTDVAAFLFRLARNCADEGQEVIYVGKESGVFAVFDPISLDTVCNHILDNAIQRKLPNTNIEISLEKLESEVRLEFKNFGPRIPEERLESIFDLGYSTGGDNGNRGQGLFVSRIYVVGMRGTIKANNFESGVIFSITLPITTA